MIRLLIIDDSFFVRQVVKKMVSEDPDIQVVGEAANGKEGVEKIRELNPDVICLDLVMPVEDGVMTIEKVITERRMPAVIFSSLSSPLSEISKNLYDMGLLYLLKKPVNPEEFPRVKKDLINNIKEAAKADMSTANINYMSAMSSSAGNPGGLGKLLIIACPGPKPVHLAVFLSYLVNAHCPIIAQQFLRAGLDEEWVNNIKKVSYMPVKFAEDGDLLAPSRILFTPNGKVMEIVRFKQHAAIQLLDPKISGKPYLDALFTTAANAYKENAVVVVLPGLSPSDGLQGMKTIRLKGGKVLVHNEQAIIKKISDEQAADKILPTEKLAEEALALINV